MQLEMIEYHPHPIAEIFPLMSGDDFVALKADIREHGLLEPIWIADGKILDGRNRFRACQEVGAIPVFREYTGNDPVAFVVSLNLKRRHLNESQRGMVAAKLANMSHGGDRKTDQAANLQLEHVTQTAAADLLNVSPRTVATAKRVQSDGVAELNQAVETGAISVSTAATLTELPPDIQVEVVTQGPEQMKEAAKDIRKAHVAHNSGDNEWYTPPEFIEAAKVVLGVIDLDPASNPAANEVVGASVYYTAEDSGLDKEWRGKVWMNPPYASNLISLFADKLAKHVESGNVSEAIVLVNNATETGWFARLGGISSALCFPKSRIKFWAPDKDKAAPLQGQAILYMGNNPGAFLSGFRRFGLVAEVRS